MRVKKDRSRSGAEPAEQVPKEQDGANKKDHKKEELLEAADFKQKVHWIQIPHPKTEMRPCSAKVLDFLNFLILLQGLI